MNDTAISLYAPRPSDEQLEASTAVPYHYHTIDLPGIGTVQGEWDLRAGTREYLGNVDFQGKRVLELGTADGYLCFWMEQQGAGVVAFDLSEQYAQDRAPSRYPAEKFAQEHKPWLRAVNNTWWRHHELFKSKAKAVYGTVYDIPTGLGQFDICTFGSILLHLREPFLALQNGLRLTKETVIVTEPIWTRRKKFATRILQRFVGPYQTFAPRWWANEPQVTWWIFSPEIIRNYVAALGFEDTKVTYHTQLLKGRKMELFTVVGRRTQPLSKV